MSYDEALRELYRVPHESFVAERKRLAGELRAGGDRAGAARLLKVARPPVSAWVVNQLYDHARDAFDELLAGAARLREGDAGAVAAHREALAKLRKRASAFLADAGHATTEATMRRVMANLAAIAATGGFEPDLPGELSADRAPPGFEAAGGMIAPAGAARPAEAHDSREDQRRAEELARRQAERERAEAAVRTARGELAGAERRVRAVEQELREAQASVGKLHAIVEELERTLANDDDQAPPVAR